MPFVANEHFESYCISNIALAAMHTESWEALAWPGFRTSYQAMSIHVLCMKRHFRMGIGES